MSWTQSEALRLAMASADPTAVPVNALRISHTTNPNDQFFYVAASESLAAYDENGNARQFAPLDFVFEPGPQSAADPMGADGRIRMQFDLAFYESAASIAAQQADDRADPWMVTVFQYFRADAQSKPLITPPPSYFVRRLIFKKTDIMIQLEANPLARVASGVGYEPQHWPPLESLIGAD